MTDSKPKPFAPIIVPLKKLESLLNGDLTNGEIRTLSKGLDMPFGEVEKALGGETIEGIDPVELMWHLGLAILPRLGFQKNEANADLITFTDEEGAAADPASFLAEAEDGGEAE